MQDVSFTERWYALNEWLQAHRDLWQPTPFTDPSPAWTHAWPELAERVAALPEEQCPALDQNPGDLADLLSPLLPSLGQWHAHTELPSLAGDADACTLPEVRARDMPGRKRLQAGAFTAAVRPLADPILDWCCGKGHLGRTLLPWGAQPVTGLEWDAALVDDGNRLARKFDDDLTIHCQDVLAPTLSLPAQVHGVALHACGDLHRHLFRRAAEANWPRLSVAPCCFHLSEQNEYRPLSVAASESSECLAVTKADMRLAVEETVTAPARVRDQVERFSQWRLGFDALQRQLRGVDEYLPVPSHPAWVGRGDFRQFCQWAADRKNLSLPETVDYDRWESAGVKRLAEVRRHELVRHLFRRPLELWLVLDYALYLEEQGYRVRVGTFCERALTPRNLLLDAVRQG